MIKLNAKHQRHMTKFGPKIKQVNSHKNIQNVRTKNEISTYYFYQSWTCKNIAKQPRNTSRIHCNFPGILREILACIGVRITRNKGAYSKKNPKKAQKPRAQYHKTHTHGYWRVRIKLTLQERWIDPDPSGSWSNAH